MAPEASEYKYERLNFDQRVMRLLQITNYLPETRSFVGKLVVVSIDRSPPYETLSYFWDVSDSPIVVIDGCNLQVHPRILQALWAFRSRSSNSLFWIDSVCMNQEDPEEKTNQMRLLLDIFTRATQTNIWLGRPEAFPPSCTAGFQLFFKLSRFRATVFNNETIPQTSQTLDIRPLEEYRRLLPHHTASCWKGLCELLNLSNFNRTWLALDYISSPNLVIYFGTMTVSWHDFAYGLEGYSSYAYPNMITAPGLANIVAFARLRKQYMKKDPLPLDLLMEQLRPLHAASPLDKVNSIISLVSPFPEDMQHGLPPDYRQTMEEQYLRVARSLALAHNGAPYLAVLSLVEDREFGKPGISNTWPSWIPNWIPPLATYRFNTVESQFNASRSTTPAEPVVCHLGTSPRIRFPGFVVDKIVGVATYLPTRQLHDKFSAASANSYLFLEWFEWMEAKARGRGAKTLRLRFAETIQAKGCELWKSRPELLSANLVDHLSTFLEFLGEEGHEETEDIRQFYAACLPSHGRRLGLTARGHFCLVSRRVMAGDLVAISIGSKVPYILRRMENYYVNIGESFVHGIMDGEALDWEGLAECVFEVR